MSHTRTIMENYLINIEVSEKSTASSFNFKEDFDPFIDEHIKILDKEISSFFYDIAPSDYNSIQKKHDIFLSLTHCGEKLVSSLRASVFDDLLLKHDLSSIKLIPYVSPEHNKLLNHLILKIKHLNDHEQNAELLKEIKHCIPFWSNNDSFRERLENILLAFPDFLAKLPFDKYLIDSMQNFKSSAINVLGDYINSFTAIDCSFPDYLCITKSTCIVDVISCIDSIIALKLKHSESINPSHFVSIFNEFATRNEHDINALLRHSLMSEDLFKCMNDTAASVFLSYSLLTALPDPDMILCNENPTYLEEDNQAFTI